MIVGIDYTGAAWQGAGIGRYVRELVHAVIPLDTSIQYRLFYSAYGLPPDSPYLHQLREVCAAHPQVRAVPIPISPRWVTVMWQKARLPLPVEFFTGRLDLVYSPDFVLPPSFAPGLLTIHDLSFLVHPECFVPNFNAYLSKAIPRNIRHAKKLIGDSEATRQDLHRLLGVDPARVSVIYPAVTPNFRLIPAEGLEPVRQRLDLPKRFLFFVGTLQPRKNLPRIIEALTLLDDSTQLVLVGKRGWMFEPIFEAIERFGLQQRVHIRENVSDADLPVVFNLAEVLLYPSLYEGFGIPVLEAFACGTPVVTSSISSMPEAAGDAAILVDPHNTAAIADGIRQAIAQRETLRERGFAQYKRFTWTLAAQQLLALFRQTARR